MVGHWFPRRINSAMAVYSLALSIGFMIAFPLVGSLVQSWGWRRAWLDRHRIDCGSRPRVAHRATELESMGYAG
jgi:hypothetical protein